MKGMAKYDFSHWGYGIDFAPLTLFINSVCLSLSQWLSQSFGVIGTRRTWHRLNFYQSDTCWKVSVKYRRFCFYFTTLIRESKWGKWGPKTFLKMHLMRTNVFSLNIKRNLIISNRHVSVHVSGLASGVFSSQILEGSCLILPPIINKWNDIPPKPKVYRYFTDFFSVPIGFRRALRQDPSNEPYIGLISGIIFYYFQYQMT